ncbi:hypothetical protein TSAR_004068 [Trichomalopsis sarcophagae]|uniref:Uncharacterized protein n=1 Tax=Trichomalopsis sarcophagae TaxID=543379 RepID=A0A232EXR2_9HYME|nr:hypothetical protein TSAR_004068 [Trichomalopsis sarcophagae]
MENLTEQGEKAGVPGRKGRPTLAGGYYQKGETKEMKRKKEIRDSTGAKNKNGTRKPRESLTRPDALVIKAAKGNSYAILRKIKAESNLTVIGNCLNKIRKPVSEGLLLNLQCTKEVKTQKLQEAVQAALVKEATIKRFQHKVVFEIKDLDMLTSEQNILEALS